MTRAKPLKESAPHTDPPPDVPPEPTIPCALCGKPIKRGDTVQPMLPDKEGGPARRAHLRCYRDLAIASTGMRRSLP